MKNIKRQLICIFIVVVMLSSLITTPVYAINSASLIRAKSWIAAAITAANIYLEPIGYAAQHAIQDSVDPFGIVNTIQEQEYSQYMDKSTIKIYPDTVEIDGVLYSDIWLSYDAADKFRTEGLDFATAYSLASNTNATYASGVGYVENVPIYNISGSNRSATYYFDFPTSVSQSNYNPYQVGNYHVDCYYTAYTPPLQSKIYTGSSPGSFNSWGNLNLGLTRTAYIRYYNGQYKWYSDAGFNMGPNGALTSAPFQFDYTSGLIPATPLDPGTGMVIRVPSEHTNTTHSDRNYNIPDFIQDYPDTTDFTFDFDPQTNPNYNVDLDINDALGDLITAIIAAYLLDLLDDPNTKIEYTVDPQPEPVVDDTIAETKYSILDHILQDIKDVLDDILETVEDWFDAVKDVLDDILSQITQDLSAIKSFLQNIYNSLSTIPTLLQTLFNDLADKILQDIEEGPIKLLDKLLDVLRTLFFPILATLKSFLGIWHYVVEWLSNISTPFTWIIGIMAATSSVLMSPIYALIAGIIVIAVYRRFGR